jgi:hypothetical protein
MRAEAIDSCGDRAGLKRVLVLVIIAGEELGLRRMQGCMWSSRAGNAWAVPSGVKSKPQVSLFI